MRSALLSTTALALFTVLAAPVAAETWVTYNEEWMRASDGGLMRYQIDAASIAKHNGWIHANHRVCINQCFPITSISAHCKDVKYRHSSTVIYTRRNGNDWWSDYEIGEGSRYKDVGKEYLEIEKQGRREVDAGYTKAFNFLCG